MKKIILILSAVTILSSCSNKPLPIYDRLTSGKPELIRTALTDAWRTGDAQSMATIAMMLGSREYSGQAAGTLAMLRSDTADIAVLGAMDPQADNTGRLFYFYLVGKERGLRKEITDRITASLQKYPPGSQTLSYMILGRPKEALGAYEKSDFTAFPEIRREIALFFGGLRYAPAYAMLAGMAAKDSAAGPHATWACNMIRNPGKISYDKKNRVITKNGYWEKDAANPAFPTQPGTYKAWHTANPDILTDNKTIYFYYRCGDGTDRITLATAPYDNFTGKNFADYPENPIIDAGPYLYDEKGVLDPAAVFFRNRVYLYYSAIGNGPDCVGLATSDDYYHFKKKQKAILTGRAPEVVLKDGVIYLYYVLMNPQGGYSVNLATSTDGIMFEGYANNPVFGPSADTAAWDGKTVTVPRIVEKDGVYYMLYAGDDKYLDYPPYFGIAFSTDLVHWTRGSQNPVFSRGPKGTFDDGGIWYGQMFPYRGRWYMWYEGWGGGESHEKEYGPGGHSQIGMATGVFKIEELL